MVTEVTAKILDPNQQLGYLVVRVADQVSRPWSRAMRTHGINPRQFSLLAVLAREPELSQGELARRVMVTPQSMSESIAGLLAAGLLRRDRPKRGWATKVALTAAGTALLRKAYPVVEASNRESFSGLTSNERKQLRHLLRKLLGE